MRILHFNAFPGVGGAGKASLRIHNVLKSQGFESIYLNALQENTSTGLYKSTFTLLFKFSLFFEKLFSRFLSLPPGDAWTVGLTGTLSPHIKILQEQYSAYIFYWTGSGFLSIFAISDLLKSGVPVFWRLSDMWPFTGGCHFSRACLGFQNACGNCHFHKGKLSIDTSYFSIYLKRKLWQTSNLTIICPSHWMATHVRTSSLFCSVKCVVLPTGVDVDLYQPRNSTLVHDQLGIHPGCRILLFVADGGTSSRRKGGTEIISIFRKVTSLARLDNPILIIVGDDEPSTSCDVYKLGRIYSEEYMAHLYSAADIFLAPYEEDNLPNTVLEALACSTPVVAYNIGGLTDAVRHHETGLLVDAYNPNLFAQAVADLLDNPTLLHAMSIRARELACAEFNVRTQVSKLIDLVTSSLGDCSRK